METLFFFYLLVPQEKKKKKKKHSCQFIVIEKHKARDKLRKYMIDRET